MKKLLTVAVSTALLSACSGGGSDTPPPVVADPVTSTPVTTPVDPAVEARDNLLTLLDSTSPTGTYEAYILPASDDFDNIPQDPSNEITAEKVALGKLIYHETGITEGDIGPSESTFSCASCHNAQNGFKSGIRQGIGEGGIGFDHRMVMEGINPEDIDVQPVASPTVLNTAFQEVMLWNGQLGNVIAGNVNVGIDPDRHFTEGTPKEANLRNFAGLETQAVAGLGVHRQGDTDDSILRTNETYREMFEAAYGVAEPDDMLEATALAIAAYERTILANQAPFQAYLKGDETAMTESEVAGAEVFFGKGNCYACHNGPALSSPVGAMADEVFMTVGFHDLDIWEDTVGEVNDATREGRGGFTGDEMEKFAFKVPPLYNLIDTTVFGHGASFSSVEDVVRYKVDAVPQHPQVETYDLDYRFTPLDLTEDEIANLVAFLENGLHDPELMRYVPESLPSGNCPINNDEVSRQELGCD
jgi:cytochrome c peroxidase